MLLIWRSGVRVKIQGDVIKPLLGIYICLYIHIYIPTYTHTYILINALK